MDESRRCCNKRSDQSTDCEPHAKRRAATTATRDKDIETGISEEPQAIHTPLPVITTTSAVEGPLAPFGATSFDVDIDCLEFVCEYKGMYYGGDINFDSHFIGVDELCQLFAGAAIAQQGIYCAVEDIAEECNVGIDCSRMEKFYVTRDGLCDTIAVIFKLVSQSNSSCARTVEMHSILLHVKKSDPRNKNILEHKIFITPVHRKDSFNTHTTIKVVLADGSVYQDTIIKENLLPWKHLFSMHDLERLLHGEPVHKMNGKSYTARTYTFVDHAGILKLVIKFLSEEKVIRQSCTYILPYVFKQGVERICLLADYERVPPFPESLKEISALKLFAPVAWPPLLQKIDINILAPRATPSALNVYLPPTLKHLSIQEFACTTRQPSLQRCGNMLQLEYLELGKYNRQISILPPRLKVLILKKYTHRIESLPPDLQDIQLLSYDNVLPSLPDSLTRLLLPMYRGSLPAVLPPHIQHVSVEKSFGTLPSTIPESLTFLRCMRHTFDIENLRICRTLGFNDPHMYNSWQVCENYLKCFDGIAPSARNAVNVYPSAKYPDDFDKLPIYRMNASGFAADDTLRVPEKLQELILCAHSQSITSYLPTGLTKLVLNGTLVDVASLRSRRERGLEDPNIYNDWNFCATYLRRWPGLLINAPPVRSGRFCIRGRPLQIGDCSPPEKNERGAGEGSIELLNDKDMHLPLHFHLLPIIEITSKAFNAMYIHLGTLPSRLERLTLSNVQHQSLPAELPASLTSLILDKYHFDLPKLPSGLKHLRIPTFRTVAFDIPDSLTFLSNYYGNIDVCDLLQKRARDKQKRLERGIDLFDRYNTWSLCRRYLDNTCCSVSCTPGAISLRNLCVVPRDFMYLPISSLDIFQNATTHIETLPALLSELSTRGNITALLTQFPSALMSLQMESFSGFLPRFPTTLTHISFTRLDAYLPPLPPNMKSLCCLSFTRSLPHLPDTLRVLILDEYDTFIASFPPQLCHLSMRKFNHELPRLPEGLQILELEKFNRPMQRLPSYICSLKLGDFDQPLAHFPSGLTSLILRSFAQVLPPLPDNLVTLHLEKFNGDIERFPSKLRKLSMGAFNRTLPSLPNSLSLMSLTMFDQDLPSLPPFLKMIYLETYTKYIPRLPVGLMHLRTPAYDGEYKPIPPKVSLLVTGAQWFRKDSRAVTSDDPTRK